mmetsp:Transcript_43571/g.102400  ORF Transcript_43571/g.102400 Transcript_43571/m.102400 type:complete len:283 (-) Transcript_43571:323-1171(-)
MLLLSTSSACRSVHKSPSSRSICSTAWSIRHFAFALEGSCLISSNLRRTSRAVRVETCSPIWKNSRTASHREQNHRGVSHASMARCALRTNLRMLTEKRCCSRRGSARSSSSFSSSSSSCARSRRLKSRPRAASQMMSAVHSFNRSTTSVTISRCSKILMSRAVLSLMTGSISFTFLALNAGAYARRCLLHSSPSAVKSPGLSGFKSRSVITGNRWRPSGLLWLAFWMSTAAAMITTSTPWIRRLTGLNSASECSRKRGSSVFPVAAEILTPRRPPRGPGNG